MIIKAYKAKMPYGRKYKKRGKRYYKKKGNSTYALALKAYKLAKAAQSEVEVKNVVHGNTSAVSANTGGTWILLNDLSQGTNVNNRIGNVVKMTSLFLRFDSWIPSGDQVIRVALVLDKQSNGSSPSTYDLLQVASPGTPTAYDYLAPLDWANRKRFRIIFDKMYSLSALQGQSGKVWEAYIKLKAKVYYTGTGASASNIQKNSLWLFVISDSTSIGYNYNARLKFIDG